MEKVLPCPLLMLVLLLVLTPGAAPSPTLAQDCNAVGTEVKEGTPQVINTTPITWYNDRYAGSLTLFVKPGSDFEGVTLYATINDVTLHTAWFLGEEKCFPRDGKWLQFRAMIWKTRTGLEFRLRSGACWEECSINTDQTLPTTLMVVAHGPSRWLTKSSNEKCEIHELENANRNLSKMCMDSPQTTTTTITPTTTNRATSTTSMTPSKMTPGYIATIAVSAAAAAVAVVVVVVFYWKRKAATSPHQAGLSPPPPDEHVIENDIYEPFDGAANHAAPQTFHSANGHRHDS